MRSSQIAYLFAIILALALFFLTGSILAFGVAAALFIIGVLLLIGVFGASRVSYGTLDLSRAIHLGEDAIITLELTRGLPVSFCLFSFRIIKESVVFSDADEKLFTVAMNTSRRRSARVAIDANRYGRLHVNVAGVWCSDPLGLFSFKIPFSESRDCIVYPTALTLATNVSHVPLSRTFGATYDTHQSGTDVDEVFDVREFQAGDHLASIHWKLSTKFDELFSRQFSRPVDFEVIVINLGMLHDPTGAAVVPEVLNAMASVSTSISYDLLRQGIFHNFALPTNNDFINCTIDDSKTYEMALDTLLNSPLSKTYDEVMSYMLSSDVAEVFTKCILVTSVFDENLWNKLAIDMDLSVVFVGRGARINEVHDVYDVIGLDANELMEHEHHIEL